MEGNLRSCFEAGCRTIQEGKRPEELSPVFYSDGKFFSLSVPGFFFPSLLSVDSLA